MHKNPIATRLFLLVLLFIGCSTTTVAEGSAKKQPHFLRASAIVTNEKGESRLQCWVFEKPFTVSQDPGTAGAASLDLANLSNVTYTVIPPRFDGGQHNAPHKQLVIFLSGKAVVSLPNSTQVGVIRPDENPLLVAIDVTGGGHITRYPSDEITTVLQVPFAPGKLPKYRVTREDGACRNSDQIIYD